MTLLITEGDVLAFEGNKVWLEMKRFLQTMEREADRDIVNPDSFEHGKAVGRRDCLRKQLDLPNQLVREIRNGGKAVSLKP